MVKYLGPKFKVVRRFNTPYLVGFCSKVSSKLTYPNEFKRYVTNYLKSKQTQYNEDRKKVQYIYGITNYKLKNYFRVLYKTHKNLIFLDILILIETRLDITLYKIGITSSIRQARQWLNHGYFLVNRYKIAYPGFKVGYSDCIQLLRKNKYILRDVKHNLFKRVFSLNTVQLSRSCYKICYVTISCYITKNVGPRDLIIKI